MSPREGQRRGNSLTMGFSMGEENLERRRFPLGGASRTFDCDASDLKERLGEGRARKHGDHQKVLPSKLKVGLRPFTVADLGSPRGKNGAAMWKLTATCCSRRKQHRTGRWRSVGRQRGPPGAPAAAADSAAPEGRLLVLVAPSLRPRALSEPRSCSSPFTRFCRSVR